MYRQRTWFLVGTLLIVTLSGCHPQRPEPAALGRIVYELPQVPGVERPYVLAPAGPDDMPMEKARSSAENGENRPEKSGGNSGP